MAELRARALPRQGNEPKGIVNTASEIWDNMKKNWRESKRRHISEQMRSGRTRMTSKPPSIFEPILPKRGFFENRSINPAVPNALSEVRATLDEHGDEIKGVVGDVARTTVAAGVVLGGTHGLLPRSEHQAVMPENRPKYVMTIPRPEAQPGAPSVVYPQDAQEQSQPKAENPSVQTPEVRVPIDPFDVNGLPAVDVTNIPTFNSQRPDSNAAAVISESITAREQFDTSLSSSATAVAEKPPQTIESTYTGPVVIEPLPDVVDHQVESVYDSKNNTDLAQLQADTVTAAEQVLAAAQAPMMQDARVAEPEQSAVVEAPRVPPAVRETTAPFSASSETSIRAKNQVISEILPNLTPQERAEFSAQIDKVSADQQSYSPDFLRDFVSRWGDAVVKTAQQRGMSPYILYGIILAECDGDENLATPNSNVVGSGMKEETAREQGLVVDIANGIDERRVISKVVPAMGRYMDRYGKYISGGGNTDYDVLVYKAGPGTLENFIRVADGGQHQSLHDAARATNAFRVMENPAIASHVTDKDDYVYVAKVTQKAAQVRAFIESQSQVSPQP